MASSINELPNLSQQEQAHANLVQQHISAIIKQQGAISFAEFMHQALYAPGLGYYSAGSQKFGSEGDFITAPEISELFSFCIANYCIEYLSNFPNTDLLEFGPGTGKLAVDVFKRLLKLGFVPQHYYLIEPSATLKARQKEFIKQELPQYMQHFVWLDTLPKEKISAIVIANEVLDAMPVHLFHYDGKQMQEYFVKENNHQFVFELDKPSSELLTNQLNVIQENYLNQQTNYTSEINLMAEGFIRSLSDCIQQGLILLIDYGFLASEYYHPQRNKGTLMCHFKHRAHGDPLIYPGLQDITAHVNFSPLIETAEKQGFSIESFSNQASFLMNAGLIDLLNENADDYFRHTQAIKLLTMPDQMGEIVKVLVLRLSS